MDLPRMRSMRTNGMTLPPMYRVGARALSLPLYPKTGHSGAPPRGPLGPTDSARTCVARARRHRAAIVQTPRPASINPAGSLYGTATLLAGAGSWRIYPGACDLRRAGVWQAHQWKRIP